MPIDIVTEVRKLSVRFGEVEKKIGDVAESLGYIVEDVSNPWNKIKSSDGSDRAGQSVKELVLTYYRVNENLCMIIGDVCRDDRHIKSAHIWPDHTKGSGLLLFQLDTCEGTNPRNFLRLQSQIEYAFDRLDVCFVPQYTSLTEFCLEVIVLNPYLLQSKDVQFRRFVRSKKGKGKLIPMTWRQLNRYKSHYKFGPSHKPFVRLILHHSIIAHKNAREKSWIKEEDEDPHRLRAIELVRNSLDGENFDKISRFFSNT